MIERAWASRPRPRVRIMRLGPRGQLQSWPPDGRYQRGAAE